jgi:hypothetical protein
VLELDKPLDEAIKMGMLVASKPLLGIMTTKEATGRSRYIPILEKIEFEACLWSH